MIVHSSVAAAEVADTVERIARGMDAAAAALSKALLGSTRTDPIYHHLHDAMNAMAAVRMRVELLQTPATPPSEA